MPQNDTAVLLYRAVDEDELGHLEETGVFAASPNGTEYKGFFFEAESADRFAQQQFAVEDRELRVVCASAPSALIARSKPHVAAQEGPGVLFANVDLRLVTRVKCDD